MRRIPLADAGFLYMEKRQTPMHVGGLYLFSLPENVDETRFLEELEAVLRFEEAYRPPFGDYVRHGRTGPMGPLYWEKDRNFDIDYHVRHSALPRPGRYRELFRLISRLHSSLLDRNRPLWETYLIEGLQNRQFALYLKIHHAVTDGVGAMHMLSSMFSTRKSERATRSPYSLESYEAYKARRRAERSARMVPREKELRNVSEVLRAQIDSTANLFGALRRFGGAFVGRGDGLAVPWHQVPRTSMNANVTGSRRFVAQSWPFERIRAVCKAVDGTLNDVVLAMCSSALRRYLMTQGELPRHSLKAMTPVSLRDESDLDSANAVGFMVADLATTHDDPEQRLRHIQRSMVAGKSLLQSLSRREAELFMQLTQAPALLTSVLGLASQFPAFSTVISNVPGPREQLYWNGASLDGIYPASIVFDGFAMNITLVSYNNELHFGVVACRRSVPHVQRIIDYLELGLQELESVAGLPGPGTAPGKSRTARAKPRSAAAAKNGARAKPGAAKAKVKAKAKAKTKAATRSGSGAAKSRPKAKAKAVAKAGNATGKSKPGAKSKAPGKVAARAKR